jgi:hypothetical protein
MDNLGLAFFGLFCFSVGPMILLIINLEGKDQNDFMLSNNVKYITSIIMGIGIFIWMVFLK